MPGTIEFCTEEKAPLYRGFIDNDKFWFMPDRKIGDENELKNFIARGKEEDDFITAMVAECVGENLCPTKGQYVQLALAIATAMAKKYEVINIPENLKIFKDKEILVSSWNIIHRVFVLEERTDFVSHIMNMFIPRIQDVDHLSNPYFDSHFVKRWENADDCFPDTWGNSVCNIKCKHLKDGSKVFSKFPEVWQKEIAGVSNCFSNIVDIINDAIL